MKLLIENGRLIDPAPARPTASEASPLPTDKFSPLPKLASRQPGFTPDRTIDASGLVASHPDNCRIFWPLASGEPGYEREG